MPMLLLVHMSWGIGHVSPKYPLQRRLSGGTIETQRFICTNAPRFPCSNYFTVHRVILEHIQAVQKALSFWKVVLWTVLTLHLQGWHPPHACFKRLCSPGSLYPLSFTVPGAFPCIHILLKWATLPPTACLPVPPALPGVFVGHEEP